MEFTGSKDKVQAANKRATTAPKTARNAAKEVRCLKRLVKGYFLVFLSE
jgi:hypothetical protein